MSRSGYCEEGDLEQWDMIRWRGVVKSAIRGKRGQKFLRALLAALDAMPEKRIVRGVEPAKNDDEWGDYCLRNREGECCTLGVACVSRDLNPDDLDPEDHERIGGAFDIATPLVQEIEWENDEFYGTPEKRWEYMRRWVALQIKEAKP